MLPRGHERLCPNMVSLGRWDRWRCRRPEKKAGLQAVGDHDGLRVQGICSVGREELPAGLAPKGEPAVEQFGVNTLDALVRRERVRRYRPVLSITVDQKSAMMARCLGHASSGIARANTGPSGQGGLLGFPRLEKRAGLKQLLLRSPKQRPTSV